APPPAGQIRHPVAPRDVPPVKAARRLGLTLNAFAQVQDELFARGFPRPDPTTGNYDLDVIDAWMDARHALPAGQSDLTATAQLRNAQELFRERRARQLGQG